MLGEGIIIKLLFWNLSHNRIENYIVGVINENDIDICLFAEYKGIDFKEVLYKLNYTYSLYDGFGGCDKVVMIARNIYRIEIRREQNRYTIYSVEGSDDEYIIAGIHLQDRRNSDADTRKNTIRKLVQDIKEQERVLKHNNTIVIGDYNANPFDDELVQKDAFNAVLFKELIMKNEYVKLDGTKYQRFYNPMLNCISEDKIVYGSHYNDSGIKSIYWYFLDQVLVRKALVNRLSEVNVIKTIEKQDLIKKIKPNSDISDHLPIVVTFIKGGHV